MYALLYIISSVFFAGQHPDPEVEELRVLIHDRARAKLNRQLSNRVSPVKKVCVAMHVRVSMYVRVCVYMYSCLSVWHVVG